MMIKLLPRHVRLKRPFQQLLPRAVEATIERLEHRMLFTASTPFTGAPIALPGTIELDDYDLGGEGIAYHDTTTGNLGASYRNDDVDIESTSDAIAPGQTSSSPGTGYNIGHIQSGEWLNYTVNVASTGAYAIDARMASAVSGGTFHVELDGANITGPMSLANTGGWQTWQTPTASNIPLSAGQHVMRLVIDGTTSTDIGNLDYLQVRQLVTGSPFSGTPYTVPGQIEAENFDNGGEGIAYHDTSTTNLGGAYRTTAVDIEPTSDTAGGYNVGHIQSGEWLNYSVNVANTANYIIDIRQATAVSGGTFHIEVDGANVTGSMSFSNTGGWQTWTTISSKSLSLAAGQHVMRLAFDGNLSYDLANVNWMNVRTASTAVTWTSIPTSPVAMDEGQIITINGKLYAFGGFNDPAFDATNRSLVYDPVAHAWSTLANMPETINHAGTIYDPNTNTIWMLGGFVGPENAPAVNHVWKYSIATNKWSAGPSMPSGTGAEAVVLVGRNIHVIGGLSQNSSRKFINTTEHWVMSLDNPGKWTNAAPMPTPRNHAGFVTLNGLIYVIGGQNLKDENTGNQAATEVYNPATDSWTTLASLPDGRSHLSDSTVVRNGKILIIGGETNGQIARSDVLQYDPVVNAWSTLTSVVLPQARKAPNVGLFGDQLIVFGGQTTVPLADGWETSLTGL